MEVTVVRDKTRFEHWQYAFMTRIERAIEWPPDKVSGSKKELEESIKAWNELKRRMKQIDWENGEAKIFFEGWKAGITFFRDELTPIIERM